MRKRTGKPVHDQRVSFHLLSHGIRDLKKRHCSVNYAAISVQDVTLMFLLVHMKDLDEVDILGVEFLNSQLEMDGSAI